MSTVGFFTADLSMNESGFNERVEFNEDISCHSAFSIFPLVEARKMNMESTRIYKTERRNHKQPHVEYKWDLHLDLSAINQAVCALGHVIDRITKGNDSINRSMIIKNLNKENKWRVLSVDDILFRCLRWLLQLLLLLVLYGLLTKTRLEKFCVTMDFWVNSVVS